MNKLNLFTQERHGIDQIWFLALYRVMKHVDEYQVTTIHLN